ncbi:hypothetical protein PR003_g4890 [Phytophthora rubi]|uniref:Alcohol dehydrogenase-like C-terminal domain-containing protein n=1 Tax=Phytophthora rubi TaxID=129364 RepID=A0A6A4G496_9STRA|nr:hypothetical protein PR002_g12158 [Phytophthora rubi]KAE9050985.1 hypothetical protein PR001_g1871 [Phytophthora rubi]KAE9351445.1 hypothetical protein PR003_g4890 [Phytophthora rubi]
MPDLTGPLLDKECIIRGIAVGSQELLRDLLRFVSEHNIQHKTFGFGRDEVLEALDYLRAGRQIEKVGIEFNQ